jgi:predicted amidohydrolase
MSSTLIQNSRKSTGKKLTVATVCMNAKLDTKINLDTFKSYIKKASEKKAKLVVFPEIALQQNPGWGRVEHQPSKEELAYLINTAETIPGSSTDELVEYAKKHDIYIVFGMTENGSDGKLYNSSIFLGPNGVIGKYRKRDLWDSETGGNEHLSWEKGSDSGVFDSSIGRVGLMICIEMSFGYGKRLSDEGADFLVTVSAWPNFAGHIYDEVSKSNAVDSGCWHIVSNQVGVVGHAVDYGHSRIVSPGGEIVVDTDAEEGMVFAVIDF